MIQTTTLNPSLLPSSPPNYPNWEAWTWNHIVLAWVCSLFLCLYTSNNHLSFGVMNYHSPTQWPGHAFSLRLRKRLSVSESSHTESDSSPPLTVRRRCSGLLDMPRFAISAEEEGLAPKKQQPDGTLLSTVQSREGLPLPIPEQPVERELHLDEDGPTTPSSTISNISSSTLTGMHLVGWDHCHREVERRLRLRTSGVGGSRWWER